MTQLPISAAAPHRHHLGAVPLVVRAELRHTHIAHLGRVGARYRRARLQLCAQLGHQLLELGAIVHELPVKVHVSRDLLEYIYVVVNLRILKRS